MGKKTEAQFVDFFHGLVAVCGGFLPFRPLNVGNNSMLLLAFDRAYLKKLNA